MVPKAWTVFTHSNPGVLGWNPTRGMDVCLHLFCFFVALCRYRPCDGLMPHPRSPTSYLKIKKLEWNEAFHRCLMLQRESFEILAALTMRSCIFWEVTLCSTVKVIRPFERAYCLHLQSQKVSQARNSMKLAASSLTMEVMCSTEMSTDYHWAQNSSEYFFPWNSYKDTRFL
jgi:hypothetical protein